MDLDNQRKNSDKTNSTSNDEFDKNNTSTTNEFSKRILCELLKTEYNEEQIKFIMDMANKFNKIIDIIINKFKNKHHFIQDFICYIVEINNELINLHPEYTDFKEETHLRFILTAKNIYNFAIELFYALNDLYNIDLNTFITLFLKRFPLKNSEK